MIKTQTNRQTLPGVLNSFTVSYKNSGQWGCYLWPEQHSVPLLAPHLLKMVYWAFLNHIIPGDFTTSETSLFLKVKTQLLFVIPAF